MRMTDNQRHWLRRLTNLFWICVLLLFFIVFILELKHTYNINIFPNVNGPLDDIYFKLKDRF